MRHERELQRVRIVCGQEHRLQAAHTLIASGETSGELETMLERAATNQEREMDSVLGAVVGLLGPLMILVMGGLVLMIVLAMLLPIFQLNELIA